MTSDILVKHDPKACYSTLAHLLGSACERHLVFDDKEFNPIFFELPRDKRIQTEIYDDLPPKRNKSELNDALEGFEGFLHDVLRIYHLDKYVVSEFIKGNHFSNYYIHPRKKILTNTDIAISAFLKKIDMNACLSRLILVNPEASFELYKKYKPFLISFGSSFTLDIDKYSQVNPLMKYSVIYYHVVYLYPLTGASFWENMEYLEYNIIRAAYRATNVEELLVLKQRIESGEKVYKILDFENECYLDPPLEVDFNVDFRFKLDINVYNVLE